MRIFATDVDGAAIAFARRGVYPAGALAGVPAALRNRYFLPSGAAFEVTKSLRSQMIFGEHDLSARVPFPRIDLVLCRNVLIYFTQPLQRIALETFAYSLRPDGRLVLGLSETVTAMPGPYDEQNARLRIYRRLPGQQPVPQAWPKVVPTAREVGIPLDRAIRSTRRDAGGAPDPAAPAEGILLGLDVGVIVVDPHYDIIRINTAARRVLGIHGTAFDQDFVHLADALPSTQIRNAIESALKGKATTAVYEVESADVSEDAPRHVQATVRPYRIVGNGVSGAVIELVDVTRVERERAGHARARQRLEKAAGVNERLLRANDELTALIADLRRSNSAMLRSSEDAQAGREEVETLNEEFQATNEELETLNEELTATVEELRIANEDLASRTEELRVKALAIEDQKRETEQEQQRLRSILASIGDAVVAYYICLSLVSNLTMSWNAYDFEFEVRLGRLSPKLLRPLHPIHYSVVENIVWKLTTIIPLGIILVFVSLTFDARFRTTPAHLLLFVPSVLLAAALAFFSGWVLATLAFWTTRVHAVSTFWDRAAFIFAGQIAPLALLPGPLQAISLVLPFGYILGVRPRSFAAA